MTPRSHGRLFMLAATTASAGLFLLASCTGQGGPTPTPTPTPTPAGTQVDVSLKEFTITPSSASAPAGSITFTAKNDGTVPHEFLVIRTDLAPDQLPKEDNGSYQENGPGTTLVDELEEIQPGSSEELTVNLTAGKYVLICNMVFVDGQGVSHAHYSEGMRTAFTVN